MSSIVIAGDTSGSVTLQAPAVSGSTVLNLPATSGTIQASGAGYTTNGVAYATSATGLVTGSALTFDGTTLLQNASGASAQANFRVQTNTAGAVANGYFNINGTDYFRIYTTSSETGLRNLQNTPMYFSVNNTEGMRLTTTGLGIGTSSPYAKIQGFTSSATLPVGWVYRSTQGSGSAIPTTFGYPYLQIGAGEFASSGTAIQTIGFGYVSANGNFPPAEIGINTTSTSGQTLGDLVFGTRSVTTNTAATERMRIDSAGNVGIGATSITPRDSGSRTLELYGTTSGRAAIKFTNATSGTGATDGMFLGYDDNLNFSIVNNESGVITFGTSNTERARIDSSGRFGVGTSSPASYGGSAFTKSVNIGSLNTITAGFSDEVTGTFRIAHASGQNILNFDTSALCFQSGGSTPTERARITSAGNLLVGTTSATGFQDGLSLYKATGNSQLIVGHGNGAASGNAYALFYYNGTVIGSITQSGTTAVLYNTTSDQRLKENIQNADSASSLIDSLQVRKFDWKADGSHQRYGFVAQELVTVYPEAVHQPIDTEDMMAVDYSKLVPLLVKEIQSLKARLDAANL